MTPEDIARTLTDLNALYKDDDDEYAVRFAPAVYEKEILRLDAKGYLKVKESCLRWQPFIFKRHQMDMKNDQQAVVELFKEVQESPTSRL
jgi:hypothetical protein